MLPFGIYPERNWDQDRFQSILAGGGIFKTQSSQVIFRIFLRVHNVLTKTQKIQNDVYLTIVQL